jgi:hypothetical protein
VKTHAIQLTDGTVVEPDRSGQTDRWFYGGEPVRVEREGEAVRIYNGDGSVAHEGTVAAGNGKAPKPKPQAVADGGARWATFNAFMDACLKHLSPVEANVWMLLFRDTKPDGMARTSSRNLAQRSGCSLRAVTHAMKLLKKAALVKVVTASTNRGSPSIFIVTKRPELCVEKLVAAKAKQQRKTVATISTVEGN